MNENEILQAACRALKRVAPEANVEALDPDRRIRDQLAFDSVDFLNFALALQEMLDVEIPECDLPLLSSLSGCIRYIQGKMG